MKKLMSVLLALLLLATTIPLGAVSVSAATSGTTGDCTWSLEGTHLTISGKGNMGNKYSSCGPWGTSVTTVTISQGVTSIGEYAFYQCTSLTSVTIPDSVTTIGDGAFYQCHALKVTSIPDNVTSIGEKAFYACFSLTSLTLPEKLLRIRNGAFYACTSLRSITIPSRVASIGDDAFFQCTALMAVVINNGVTNIGNSAFKGCYKLSSINIPVSVTNIGRSAFDGCSALSSITIGNGVTTIGSYAFSECSSLTSVTMGNSVTNIGQFAFYKCTKLTDVHITDLAAWCAIDFNDGYTSPYANPLYFADNFYWNGTPITDKLVIPDSATKIGKLAFVGQNFSTVIIPDSVLSIGDHAFYNCTDLSTIIIGNGVRYIGWEPFWKTAYINNSANWENRELYIGNYLIDSKTYNGHVAIREGTLVIAESVFDNIPSISIPKSVVTVGDDAFSNCYTLTTVYYEGSESDREKISIGSYNDRFVNAVWHYNGCKGAFDAICDAACNGCGAVRTPADHVYDHDFDVDCNECGDIREVEMPLSFGGNSVSEDVSGLGFKFDVAVSGMAVANGTTAVYDNATINGFRLVKMGALVSNSKSEIDIEAIYLCDLEANSASYAVRVIDIPTENYDSVITTIPYIVLEIDGVVTTFYGEAQIATFNNSLNN